MKHQLADGFVEIQGSGRSCPPGFTGQAGNKSTTWFRVSGGEWELLDRNRQYAIEALECAETVAEFRELLER